jgi:hypothetical protein
MGKGQKESARSERLRALYDAGDHGAARRLAAEVLGDAAATGAEQEQAAAIRLRTSPDRAAVLAGIAGAVVAVTLSAWLVAR